MARGGTQRLGAGIEEVEAGGRVRAFMYMKALHVCSPLPLLSTL